MQADFSLGEKQRQLFWDDRRYVVYVGGRGTGKTTAAVMRLMGMMQRGELKSRTLVIGPDYTQLSDGTLKTFDYWFDMAGLIKHRVNGNKPLRVLHNGLEFMFRSGMNPEQTRSKECPVVWLDEGAQMDESVFTLTNANVRPTGIRPLDDQTVYQTIITTTPRGKNWIWRRFVNHETSVNPNRVGYYHMTTLEAEEQGICRPGYVEELGYAQGSQMYQQEVMADYVSWTGLVYRQDYRLIGPDHPLPKLQYVAGAIDVGTIAPTCMLVGGVDERNAVWIVREFYQPRALLSEVCDRAGQWTRDLHVRSWDVDNDLLWKMMRNAGLQAKPPNKTKDAAGMMVNYVNDLTARGMYHIDPSCRGLISEKARYEYKDRTSGDEVTFLDKVKPNQDDHALDTERYLVKRLSAWKKHQSYGGEVGFAIG